VGRLKIKKEGMKLKIRDRGGKEKVRRGFDERKEYRVRRSGD
jgi:hypothetical protein